MPATKKKSPHPKRRSSVKYEALGFRQRPNGALIVMFVAPVADVLGFSQVDFLGPTTSGPQREQKEARVQAISKFVSNATANTIPTAVIIAFDIGGASFIRSSQGSMKGILTIQGGATKPGTIVDGQHRLYGIHAADPHMPVAIVGLLEADAVERAFQFLVINNKASRVPATHTKALLAKMEGSGLAERLKAARLSFDVEGIKDIDLVNSDKESPFYNSIDWTTTPIGKRMVQATAIEQSLDYLGGLGIAEYDDRDVRRAVFLAMWKVIKSEWKAIWKPGSRLLSKVGVVCLTRFVADRITSWADSDELDIEVTDLGVIESQTKKITEYMDTRFWTTPWAEKAQGGFDTAQGRDRVLAAIVQLYRNGKRDVAWYSDIEIVDRSQAK